MNRERGGHLSRSGGWCILLCSRSGMAPAATGVKALPYAHQVTFQALVRSLSPARRRVPGSRARYKLHGRDVRDSVRGSSNNALKLTADGSEVGLCIGCAAA
jgi:hypothetical protein